MPGPGTDLVHNIRQLTLTVYSDIFRWNVNDVANWFLCFKYGILNTVGKD